MPRHLIYFVLVLFLGFRPVNNLDGNFLKCGRCFVTYHLGMIYAIIQVGPMGNQTGFRGVPYLYANHYTVGIGKEKAPNFPVA